MKGVFKHILVKISSFLHKQKPSLKKKYFQLHCGKKEMQHKREENGDKQPIKGQTGFIWVYGKLFKMLLFYPFGLKLFKINK